MKKNCNKKILKSKRYYKLAKNIDLTKYKTTTRKYSGELGLSTAKYGHLWYNLPKGKAIFKTFDGEEYCSEVKQYRIINEVICNKLANQVGLSCAKYEKAHFNQTEGLVSYNILSDEYNEILLTGHEILQDEDIIDSYITQYVEKIQQTKNYHINKKQMIIDLYKITLFDAIVFQTDRHPSNLHFIHNKTTNSLKVAPLIDNEFAFYSEYIQSFIPEFEVDCVEIVKNYSYNLKKMFVYQQNYLNEYSYYSNLQALVSVANKNPLLKKELVNFINNLNIKKAIEETKKEGIDIPPSYENYMIKLTSVSKGLLRKILVENKDKDIKSYLQEYNIPEIKL